MESKQVRLPAARTVSTVFTLDASRRRCHDHNRTRGGDEQDEHSGYGSEVDRGLRPADLRGEVEPARLGVGTDERRGAVRADAVRLAADVSAQPGSGLRVRGRE